MFFNTLPLIRLFMFLSLLRTTVFAFRRLPQDEVDALNEMARKMGATNWTFSANSCGDVVSPSAPTDPERNITCGNCEFENNTCHVIELEIKRFSLPGELPPELSRLRYLERIDFAYNCLSGSIPREWGSLQLKTISLLANRLSGNIPSHLENFTSLTYLSLELNNFSGTIPPAIGKLVNLRSLHLSSNNLSGNLPIELSELNLTDFRINDNNLNGSIPEFIQNWTQLRRLEIQASGLQGPIPSSISRFEELTELRISDISSMEQEFPDLRKSTGLRRLVLRRCNITGEIPLYIWVLSTLRTLDLSFNNLHGPIPSEPPSTDLIFLFLTGNSLSGNIPSLRVGINVDLSYNNFTRQTEQRGCQQKENLNLFRSSAMGKDIGGACVENFICQTYSYSLYINCGGGNVKIDGKDYKGDDGALADSATFYGNNDGWGFSSTGDFMDNNDDSNKPYTVNSTSADLGELYRTARSSPISLTYYHHCLLNLNYTVTLHFAEIEFPNDGTYYSLGRRIFDIYVQDHLIEKDFNIEYEASGAMKPIPKRYNASVTNGTLDIRFYWAGKGTTRIPDAGFYGPLISAISVDPLNYNPPSEGGSTNVGAIIGGVLGFFLLLLGLSFLWWRRRSKDTNPVRRDFEGTEFQTVSFTLKQIKAATNNFDSANKIGEGGFGPVYKGLLADGTVVAVKQLSSKSSQGNREFLNEIGVISCLQHPNLVRLHGCCIGGDQLLLVYEYMENNSLAHVLFGSGTSHLKLEWKIRHRICLGIAKGLAFLHEESRLKIVHRDIKATNVLLDKDLNPKISDFGLAKLDDNDKTHISTRVAGTIGYMAPEYALWGYLTDKADVYSFGVVALEIVSRKNNLSYGPENNFACLLDWACHLQQRGELLEIVDKNLGTEFDKVEAERMVKVALLCTNGSPTLRPIMSDVVRMLEGTNAIPDEIPEAEDYNRDLRFKAIREHRKILNSRNSQGSLRSDESCSVSAKDLYSIRTVEEYPRNESWIENSKNRESRSFSTNAPSANVSSSIASHDLYEISLSSQ